MKNKLFKIRHKLKELSLHALLVSKPSNVIFLTGFAGLTTGQKEAFLIVTSNLAHFITYATYKGFFKTSKQQDKIHYVTPQISLTQIINHIIEEEEITQLAIETDGLTV